MIWWSSDRFSLNCKNGCTLDFYFVYVLVIQHSTIAILCLFLIEFLSIGIATIICIIQYECKRFFFMCFQSNTWEYIIRRISSQRNAIFCIGWNLSTSIRYFCCSLFCSHFSTSINHLVKRRRDFFECQFFFCFFFFHFYMIQNLYVQKGKDRHWWFPWKIMRILLVWHMIDFEYLSFCFTL